MSHSNAEAGPSTYAVPSAPLAPLAPDTASGLVRPSIGEGDVGQNNGPHVFTEAQIEEWKEQDRYLPIANVGRIMKNILPDNAKIAKEAKECVQECVSEFISFLSSEAADKVLTDKRKTINGEDVIYSMNQLGFDNYSEACKVYLTKYRHWLNEQQARHTSRHNSPDHLHPSGDSPSSSILEHLANGDDDDDSLSDMDGDDLVRGEAVPAPVAGKKKNTNAAAGVTAGQSKSKSGKPNGTGVEGGTKPAGKKRKSTGGGVAGDGNKEEGKKRKGAAGNKVKGV